MGAMRSPCRPPATTSGWRTAITGPNTGGMGAYSPLPDLSDEAVEAIVAGVHRPILAELARRGSPFRGALYAGLILTADGPVLLECNARFGDPETQVILPRLAVPLGPLLRAAAHRELAAAAANARASVRRSLPVLPGAAVGIVLASAGYPGQAAPRRHDRGAQRRRRRRAAWRDGRRPRLPVRDAALGEDGTLRTTAGAS